MRSKFSRPTDALMAYVKRSDAVVRKRRAHAPPARLLRQFMMPEEALADRADLLRLPGPEMTVLLGGLRVLGAHTTGSKHGVFTAMPGTLANDFFVNLLGMRTKWHRTGGDVYGAGTAKRTSSSGRAPGST